MWSVYEYTRCLACISYDQKKPMRKNERIIVFSFVFRVFLSFFFILRCLSGFTTSSPSCIKLFHARVWHKWFQYIDSVQYILYANKCFTFCLSYKEMFFFVHFALIAYIHTALWICFCVFACATELQLNQ